MGFDGGGATDLEISSGGGRGVVEDSYFDGASFFRKSRRLGSRSRRASFLEEGSCSEGLDQNQDMIAIDWCFWNGGEVLVLRVCEINLADLEGYRGSSKLRVYSVGAHKIVGCRNLQQHLHTSLQHDQFTRPSLKQDPLNHHVFSR